MESLNGNHNTSVNQLWELEAQNQLLRTEIQLLRAAHHNLTEQQDLAEKYQESQFRFQSIFYQSNLGNKIIGSDLNVIQINTALQAILGYTEKEIVGTNITTYAHPDFVHHWQELQENLWTKQVPSFQLETCLIKKDGSILWCQVTSIIFKDQGTTLGYTIVEDINKRKRLELELKELYNNQEAILHMVAHDLKSPLHNIQLLNGLLKENLEDLRVVVEEQKADSCKLIQVASDTCDKALAIIDDLLFIGKLEAGEGTLIKIDLQSFIQSQLNQLGLGAQKKGIPINFQLSPVPVDALIHLPTFKRVLENLISNAVKFTPSGGQVTLSLESKENKVLLQVRDTGIGIPEHMQASIFHKFTQANRVGTAGESTTGLGLYIVKQIVEKHQGKIWVESKEKFGTTFFIQLNAL